MDLIDLTLIGFIIVFRLHVTSTNSSDSAEKRLHRDLLFRRNYYKIIRPAGSDKNKSAETLTVKLGMRLSQLLDIVSSNRYL